jgi:hypothetical protein
MRHAGGSFGSRRGGSCHARTGAARRPFAAAVARILPRSRIPSRDRSRALRHSDRRGSVRQGRPGRAKNCMPARPRGPAPAPGRGLLAGPDPRSGPRPPSPAIAPPRLVSSSHACLDGRRDFARGRLSTIQGVLWSRNRGSRLATARTSIRAHIQSPWRPRHGVAAPGRISGAAGAAEATYQHRGAYSEDTPAGAAEATYRHSLHPSSAANAARRYNPGRCRIPSSS